MAKEVPVDRSTDTHRVVSFDPNNPIHNDIMYNPAKNPDSFIKKFKVYTPLPGTRTTVLTPENIAAETGAKIERIPAKKAAPKRTAPAKPAVSESNESEEVLSKPVKNIQKPGAALDRAKADEARNARVRAAKAAKNKK